MPKLIKSEQAIKEKVELLAKQLNDDYKNIDILNIVCFLNGASLFCSDLIRLLKIPIKLHFFGFRSYGNMSPSGEVEIEKDLKYPLNGRHVLFTRGLGYQR